MNNLDKVKEVIKENYSDAYRGIFFTRNFFGDPMSTIFENDDITIDICYYYAYFEIFGLTDEEEEEIEKYYDSLKRRKRR